MSDHDPNGDDDFMKGRRDDSNMGHQSVPQRHRTLAYSIVDSSRNAREMPAVQATPIVNVNSALAPTEEMEAFPPNVTVKNVIKELIEVNVMAWKKLPVSVQEMMLSTPEKFRFYRFANALPDLIFNGVRFHFENDNWCLFSVEVK